MFAGSRIRESSKSTSRTVARDAERSRRRELEESFNRITKRRTVLMFSVAAEDWLSAKAAHLAPRSVKIERANLKHISPIFGKMLICDIGPDHIARYQGERTKAGASPKTVNLEVGTLRAILRKYRLWAAIQPDVRMLRVSNDIGVAICREDEARLLDACRESRSRSLLPSAVLALNTGMRYSELRLLRWANVNLAAHTLTVGASKTESGAGRVIPLNERAQTILSFWASIFPERLPEHYVFPSERYAGFGTGFRATRVLKTDPTKPIGRWKEAWETAKKRAAVVCRFHDLRHTACTRLLEAGVPFSVVASIMGWSASTTVRMAKRYGHIGQEAQRLAVAAINGPRIESQYPQKSPQLPHRPTGTHSN
jgi:integrase